MTNQNSNETVNEALATAPAYSVAPITMVDANGTAHQVRPARFGASVAGCWLDGVHGQAENDRRVVLLAESYGYLPHGSREDLDTNDEYAAEEAADALDFLNEHAVAEGCWFEWVDGDLILEAFEEPSEEDFDEFLDDCWPAVEMGNLTFPMSRVLRECDPIAYRCEYLDYVDARREDWEYNRGR